MLLSAFIYLTAQEKTSLPAETGTAIRAELLNRIQAVHPTRSADLHNGSLLRPFSISDLQGTFHFENGYRVLKKGQSIYFRVTSLTTEDSHILLESVFPNLQGEMIELAHQPFYVEKNIEIQHKLSYQELIEKYFNVHVSPPVFIDIAFDSPTTFNTEYGVMPLPIPILVFNSWLRHWNQFAEKELPQEVKKIEEALISLSRYQKLRTQVVTLTRGTPENPKKIPMIGFTGLCRFRINTTDSFWINTCHVLADFSVFCGTGVKTSYGLGQTRKANELDWKNTRT